MEEVQSYRLKLIFVAPCLRCNEARTVRREGLCPVCNDPLAADELQVVRAAIKRRRQVFKGRLVRLEEQASQVMHSTLPFQNRGVPLDFAAHNDTVMRPALNALDARKDAVRDLLGSQSWDPDEAGCIAAFNELVGLLTDALNQIERLRETMPPIEWRATHRELVRATIECTRAQISMTMTIVAADAHEARTRGAKAQTELDAATKHISRVAALIARIGQLPPDGPFQLDGSIDVAALAWSSAANSSTSIVDAATLVRGSFAEIPSISTLADEHAVLLLPLLAMSAVSVDQELLVQRTVQLRAVLDAADAAASWLQDPELLVSRVYRGLARTTAEAERLGRHVRYGLPRIDVIRVLAEAYRQLVEGALRDLGGPFIVAGRAQRQEDNGTYELPVTEGIKAGEVVSELDRIGGPCSRAIDMLYRNANAHADFEITDTGVIARERVIEGGRVTSETPSTLSDAEFHEEVASLQELLLALQLTLLPWIWTHTDARILAALSSVTPSQNHQNYTIGLIAGMAGLHDVTVSVADDTVTVSAAARDDSAVGPEVRVLTVVPAVFGGMPDVTSVTFVVAGRQPVTFERSEFDGIGTDASPYELAMLGLTNTKWLMSSGVGLSAKEEAALVAFPLIQLCFDCIKLVNSAAVTAKDIEQAVARLQAYVARLDRTFPHKHRSSSSVRAVTEADKLVRNLVGLAEFVRGRRSSAEHAQFAQGITTAWPALYELQEAVKVIRDESH